MFTFSDASVQKTPRKTTGDLTDPGEQPIKMNLTVKQCQCLATSGGKSIVFSTGHQSLSLS